LGGFHGGTPIAGWFISWEIHGKKLQKMDDWGLPLWKPRPIGTSKALCLRWYSAFMAACRSAASMSLARCAAGVQGREETLDSDAISWKCFVRSWANGVPSGNFLQFAIENGPFSSLIY
jgi:hypothetical protein